MNLIDEYKELKDSVNAIEFLYGKFGDLNGGLDFIDAVHLGLKKTGRELVWFCGMFDNYHNHNDYSIDNLLRTKKHFKNVALGFLNKQEYDPFNTWIKNWSNTLIICNYIAPDRWENVKDPVREELNFDDLP